MPMFARRPSTMSSSIPVELRQNYMAGQQRQQISELQFEKFPTPQSFFKLENSIQKLSDYLFLFSIGHYVMEQRSGVG